LRNDFRGVAWFYQQNMQTAIAKGAAREKLQFNEETLAAIQEARAIASGQLEAKIYTSVDELNAELDAEYEAESSE